MKMRNVALRTAETRPTRDLILDVAEACFAERGFAAVSVREIAADVGLKNQASLYHHFRNKRALYEAVLARGVEALVEMVAGSVVQGADGGNAIDAVETSLDRVVDYLVEHPHLPRLIQRAGIDDTRYLRTAVTHLLRPLYAHGMDVLAHARTPVESEALPQVAAGLYHLIFAYFADAKLLEAVTQVDPLSPAAITRQRRFLKSVVAYVLGVKRTARVARLDRPTRN